MEKLPYTSKDTIAEERQMQDYWRGARDNSSDTVQDAKIRGYENLRDIAERSGLPEEISRLNGIVKDLKQFKTR